MAVYKQASTLDFFTFIIESEESLDKIFEYYSINEETTALALRTNNSNSNNNSSDNKDDNDSPKQKEESKVDDKKKSNRIKQVMNSLIAKVKKILTNIANFFKGIFERVKRAMTNIKEKVIPYLAKLVKAYQKYKLTSTGTTSIYVYGYKFTPEKVPDHGDYDATEMVEDAYDISILPEEFFNFKNYEGKKVNKDELKMKIREKYTGVSGIESDKDFLDTLNKLYRNGKDKQTKLTYNVDKSFINTKINEFNNLSKKHEKMNEKDIRLKYINNAFINFNMLANKAEIQINKQVENDNVKFSKFDKEQENRRVTLDDIGGITNISGIGHYYEVFTDYVDCYRTAIASLGGAYMAEISYIKDYIDQQTAIINELKELKLVQTVNREEDVKESYMVNYLADIKLV